MILLRWLLGLILHADAAGVGVLLVTTLVLAVRKRRPRCRTAILCLTPLVAIHATPLGWWLLAPLETRFPRPGPFPGGLPEDVTGLILLGGSFELKVSQERGEPIYNPAAPRLFESIALARRYPHARVVYTGNEIEARLAARVFAEQGLEASRITLEGASANTLDNARKTFPLVQPGPGEKWVVVTSAFHVPRAMGLFRGTGWDVTAYPVNYMTSGGPALPEWLKVPWRPNGLAFRIAVHEWVGLVYHHAAGDSPALFPAP